MYWDDFRRKYKDDPRFKAMKITKEKEALFKEHVKYNLNKMTDPTEAYLNLLKETKEITKGIRWRDAKKILEVDDRYYLLDDKDKREDIFRDYLETI
jgi:transcription elongation regulator 1